MTRQRTPLLLRVELKYECEHAGHVLGPLMRSIERDFWKCTQGRRSMCYVIVTAESSRELVTRLKLADNESIEDYSCFVAPIGAVSKHGGFNTLHVALDKAWQAVGDRRHPAYRGQRQRFDPRRQERQVDVEFGAVREGRRWGKAAVFDRTAHDRGA